MAITTLDALAAALPGQASEIIKDDATGLTAGRRHSLWRVTGSPGVGTDPATTNGVIPTSATTGAVPFTNPGAGFSYLAQMSVLFGQTGTLFMYDRVLHSNGFNNTATPGVPVSVDRPASAQRNALFIEVYTATTSSRTVTVTYTDQDGNAGQVSATVTLPACPAGTMIPVPLATGDVGVRKVESVACSGATGGSWGFTVAVMLARIGTSVANSEETRDVISELGFKTIGDNACIAFAFFPKGTSMGGISINYAIAQG